MKELKTIYKTIQPYIIVIFITISFTIFITKGSSDSSFVENFNFASTITSIILSIIAILLTLIDGEKSTSALDKISKSTESLTGASDKIEIFINQLLETKDSIYETKNSLENGNLQIREVLATMFEENSVTQEIDKDTDLNLDFEKLLYNFPHSIRQYILFAYETYKLHKSVDIIDFSNFYKNEMINDDLPGYDISSDLVTTLTVLRGFNILEFCMNEKGFLSVDYISNDFEKAIKNVIPSEDYFADAPDARFFGTVYKYFKTL